MIKSSRITQMSGIIFGCLLAIPLLLAGGIVLWLTWAALSS